MIETLAWPVWPHFAEDEINSVARVLRSGRVNYWTGDVCREFETEFARFCGAQYAVAMANGTVALEAALRALEIGPGDEVIVPARTFIATASCVAVLGATPVVADIEAYSQNISAATIAPCLSAKTKAIIVVHLAGLACEMQPILELAAQHHLYVIEDCAQAHGAMYRGQMVGTCGDIAAFSFCQDKIMTTAGEGGMVLTNDAQLWERVWAYKDHGKNWARANMPSMSDYRFVHDQFGSNGRMTEVQAAIGLAQLQKLPQWLVQRQRNAAVYQEILSIRPEVVMLQPASHLRHAYYKFYFFIAPDCLASHWDRARLLRSIQASGVPCTAGVCPNIAQELAFQSFTQTPHPIADQLGMSGYCLQVHPTLTEDHCRDAAKRVLACINEALA